MGHVVSDYRCQTTHKITNNILKTLRKHKLVKPLKSLAII